MSIGKDVHQAVMVAEVLTGLNIQSNGIYVDATFGRGGHARAILNKLGKTGRLLVMDRDPLAIEAAQELAKADVRVCVRHSPFSKLYAFCQDMDVVGKVNGILLDLGVSSPQLDNGERGFSFRLDGPLDMRMDPTTGISAAEWINVETEEVLSCIFQQFGEERFHRRIAHAIVEARMIDPITTTLQLASIVSKAHPAWERHKHPATRVFQAIRLFINNELNELSTCLEHMLPVLASESRMAVISFHSLEDRIVKQFIQKHERGDEHPRGLPIPFVELNQRLRRVGKKLKPIDSEINRNPRSRSAVLRVAEHVMPKVRAL